MNDKTALKFEEGNVSAPLHAWIDAGGTFTDCYVAASTDSHDWLAEVRSGKILSSGRVPIHIERDPDPHCVLSPQLAADSSGFWVGAELIALDADGSEVVRLTVQRFTGLPTHGKLGLDRDIPPEVWNQAQRFELRTEFHAPVLGIRRLLGRALTEALPPLHIRLGTTRGTNALLTRRGAHTAFAITAPFEDLLHIGDQTRDDLFALTVVKSPPLPSKIMGVAERLDQDGSVLLPLDIERAKRDLRECRDAGCDSLAICLMHAYVNPTHERRLAELAYEAGFEHVSVSSELASVMDFVARSETAAVDAYLSPVIRSYLQDLQSQFQSHLVRDQVGEFHPILASDTGEQELLVMTSAGGLVPWDQFQGKDSILSGPAGGICALDAMREAICHSGTSRSTALIGLDMGGTSTDVSRVSKKPAIEYESSKAGVRLLTPTLPIETVAAGGGSICWFDGVSLRVGPDSAGADPGPACYGRGGPLTVTDLNVFLGRIPDTQFPFPIHHDAITDRLQELYETIHEDLPVNSVKELANGLRTLANEQMAEAVRTVTISQGADPRNHALVGFGGAAGQHVCEIANLLDVSTIYDSSEAGKLSALGMGFADLRVDAVVPVYRLIHEVPWRTLDGQVAASIESLKTEAFTHSQTEVWLELRYDGTDASLRLPLEASLSSTDASLLNSHFHELHQERFGYQHDKPIELVSVRIEQKVACAHRLSKAQANLKNSDSTPEKLRLENSDAAYPLVQRASLLPGQCVSGPCVVANQGSTLVVETDWQFEVLSEGTLRLERVDSRSGTSEQVRNTSSFDPVFRECFAARLTAIATQMGVVLQQTAASVNVKQRRDFSCALFDATGNLLANAPHVPVHLGAMGQTVREVLKQFPRLSPGQSFITNDPYCGGSHLPDVTVVTPVFDEAPNPKLQMLVANRAHHADIGGIAPGSMSVDATVLGEEGIIIPVMQIASNHRLELQELQLLFENAKDPPRDIAQNLADIHAQWAANLRGYSLLQDYAQNETWEKLSVYSEHLLAMAEKHLQRFAESMEPHGLLQFKDQLDDGTPIAVGIESREQRLLIDFSGSGPANPKNFNANPSIVTAAVLYVLRLLVQSDMPLNEGALRAIKLQIPEGILSPPRGNSPAQRPAVAAGNVETSQRIVDVVLGAFGVAGASQGTMNNLLFGNHEFGFYETICGGAGATAAGPGASAIHTHMTNTRLTDPEVLEHNYPVRLKEFKIRAGSGGGGLHAGGDGIIREIEFLEDVTLSLLTSRRTTQPYGMGGGQPGQTGKNRLCRISQADAQAQEPVFEELPACCSLGVQRGDRVRIETPGGGGLGDKPLKRN